MYLKNDTTGRISEFRDYQQGWAPSSPEGTPVTQDEIDAYLLAKDKISKIKILKLARIDFCEAGFLYSGYSFGLNSESTQNIVLKNNLLAYESNQISVIASSKKYNLPAGNKVEFAPGQKVDIAGFSQGGNNGRKTVVNTDGNQIAVEEDLIDESAGSNASVTMPDRYKYYDINGDQINFTNQTGWDIFFNAIMPEKDRVMRYYCEKKKAINDAANMAALDAITIDFSL